MKYSQADLDKIMRLDDITVEHVQCATDEWWLSNVFRFDRDDPRRIAGIARIWKICKSMPGVSLDMLKNFPDSAVLVVYQPGQPKYELTTFKHIEDARAKAREIYKHMNSYSVCNGQWAGSCRIETREACLTGQANLR